MLAAVQSSQLDLFSDARFDQEQALWLDLTLNIHSHLVSDALRDRYLSKSNKAKVIKQKR